MPDFADALVSIQGREQLVHMLAYSVRCPEVAWFAIERLNPLDFDESTQLDFMIVWHISKMYWTEYGQVPPQHYLRSMSVSVLWQRGYQEPVYHEGVRRLVDSIYALQDLSNNDYGKKLLHAFFNDIFLKELKALSEQPADRTDIIEEVAQRHRRLSVSEIEQVDPFDLTVKPTFPKRTPTGTTFFDLLLGGGLLPAETIGLLGPSGGGKTLLALQISCSLAERQHYVEYFTYEQPAKDLQPRVLSCAAKVSSTKILGKTWDQMDSTSRQKIEEHATQRKAYLNLLDRSSEGCSISEIAGHIDKRIRLGKKPMLVVIDWIWPLVVRMTARSDRRGVDERKLLMAAMEDIKSLASETGVCFLVVHQLSTEVVKKSPGKKPQWFNSAEAGSFAWFLPYCFAIGTADPNGYCWLVGSKARNNATKEVMLRLNGEYNRFQATDKSMVFDVARQEFVNQDDVGKMPGMPGKVTPADGEEDEPPDADSEDHIAGIGGLQA
ncbi:hypothetical protein LCGC14_0400020 [marine sediment metagenome]|uniref:SF4 helicase domain-containing protein n=1 Tax=marine sediment metagenome TaxID=412755 RepID=A0A0F9SXA5_9ZZZZ